MKREVFELNSGIKVVYQRSQSKLVHFGVLVSAGSRDELVSNGCAHLLEHMMFKGTKRRSFEEILGYIEGVGGEFNAYTSREETCYYISILKDFFERPIDVLSDMMFDAIFLLDELLKEKEVIVDEINFYNDTPSELIVDDFEQKLFEGNTLGNRILGTAETVRSISDDDLRMFYEEFYVPKNFILSFVGDVLFEDFKKAIENYFDGRIKYGQKSRLRCTIKKKENAFYEQIKMKTSQAHCIVGCETFKMSNEKRFEMFLFNNFFGGSSFNSILNLSLRERNGITYNIESNYSTYTDIAVFSVYFGTDKKKVEKCLDVIKCELGEISSGMLSNLAFESYKTQIIGQLAIVSDNLLNEMISNAKNLLYSETLYSFEELSDIYKSISKKSVEDLILENIVFDKMSVLVYK